MTRRYLRLHLLLSLAFVAGPAIAAAQQPNREMGAIPMAVERLGLSESKLPPLPEIPSGFIDREIDFASVELKTLPVYTLEAVLQLAAANNPTVRQARLQISGETAKALQAGLYPNPVLMYLGEKINSGGRAGEFQGFEVQQRFVTANKLELSRLKYRQRAHVSEHLAIAQQYRVSNDTQTHFFKVLAAADRLNLQKELLKTAEDTSLTARELFNQGQTTVPDIRRANVHLQQHRLNVLNAENELAEAFRQLASLVGCPLPWGIVEGDLRPQRTLPSFETVFSGLVQDSPEILAARAKLVADQTTVQRESVQWIPDVVVQAGPGYNFINYDPVYNASLRMELPIYDRNQGTVLQARRDLSRQQEEIRRVELMLRDRLALAFRTYATSLQHATEYERVIIPQSKLAYAELLQSYQENRVDWPKVLDAQHEYFAARLKQVDQFRNVRIQETLIDGFLLEGGLMAAQGASPPGHIDAVPKPR